MPRLLQIASLHPDAQKRLEASYDLIRAELPAIDAAWLAANAASIEGVVTGGHLGVPPDLMREMNHAEVARPSDLPKVTEALVRRGFDESSIRKVLGGNVVRVLREVMGVPKA